MRPFSSLLVLSLTAFITVQTFADELPVLPSDQEIIEQQTELNAERMRDSSGFDWGLFDRLKPTNQCKYAIQVPDPVTRGTIALTFDDGPNPATTPKVLAVLRNHNIKATFFVLGGKIRGHEALIQTILAEGHHVGNHSYSHPNFHTLSPAKQSSEVRTTDNLLRQFETPIYFRFPFGNSTCEAKSLVSSMGYRIVGWDIDSCDWAFADGYVSDKENQTCLAPANLRRDYVTYVMTQVKKTQGGVILMHDIHENTANNLDRIITLLEQQNYRFVTLDDTNIFPKLNQK